MNTELEDLTPMPFGKFRGQPMQDVPVTYLHWLCHQASGPNIEPIKAYCKKSLSALKQENPDLIWDLK